MVALKRGKVLGEEVVQHHVLSHRFKPDELAGALAWLSEKRHRRQRLESVGFWTITGLLMVLTVLL